MVFLGILEDKYLQHVPATVTLKEKESQSPAQGRAGLKHGTGKDADLFLVPQPSDDPNDPLNWSSTKKYTIMFIISYGAIIYVAVLAPLLSPALVIIARDFDVDISDITVISGYMLLVTGASGPIMCALSRKYGKRPFLILSSMLGLIGTIVGSAVNSYDGVLAARIIQGGSITAFESLGVSMIGDMFFVHQRGIWMTVIQFILAAAPNFSAIIVGPICVHLGWRYLFHMLVAFSALETALLLLFVPETQYNRDHRYETDELVDDELSDPAEAEKRQSATRVHEVSTSPAQAAKPKKSFAQELALFSGTYSDDNLLQLVIAPFAVCTNLAVLWMVIVTGTSTAFFVAQSYDMAQMFMAEPYNLDAAGVGYLSLGPFLGGLLASLILGITMDRVTVKWCAKKNGGTYEPEYRLLGMLLSLTAGTGLFAFGYMTQRHFSYYATSAMYGLDLFGIVCACTSASAYAIDAFRDMSSEAFIANMAYKNFLFYGFSYFVNDWTAVRGPQTVFFTFGGLALAITLTTPIFFFWGKRYRSFWCRNNLLRKWGIRTHTEL